MRFNVGDYLADTMHLSTFQHGIYILLIMHYFKRGELPQDETALRRIAKCPLRQWRAESGPVKALFMYENGVARHRRIDAERNDAKRVSEARRNAGKMGAKAKWGVANATDNGAKHGNDADGNCQARAQPRAGDTTATTTTNKKAPPSGPPASGGKREGADRNDGGGKNGRFMNAWDAEGKLIVEEKGGRLDEPIKRARAISTSRH